MIRYILTIVITKYRDQVEKLRREERTTRIKLISKMMQLVQSEDRP